MFLQNLKSVALPVSEIIRGTQKIWAAPGYAHAPFSPKFLWAFIRIGPVNVLAVYMKSVALPVPEIIGVPKKFGQPMDTPTLPFLQSYYGLLVGLAL